MGKRFLFLFLAGLVAVSLGAGAQEAVRELGQPDFHSYMPNRLDARGLNHPWGVAVDASRSPNGIWVLDAGNNRALGWRDLAAMRNGAPADVILGQPGASTNGCNTGGLSASSLCVVTNPYYSSYEAGLAVDREGNLFVTDQVNLRIVGYRRPFDTDRVADVVLGAGDLFFPHGLAADAQGNLYVADSNRVLEYDRPFATDGAIDRVFGLEQLAYADDVDLDAQGRLYVADGWFDQVLVWKEPLARQGAPDLVFSQGVRPCSSYAGCNTKGIVVEPDGDVWVGSRDRRRIFGYRTPVDGDTVPDRVLVTSGPAAKSADARPWTAGGGLDVDSTGTLWLADENRVLGFLDPWNGDGRADRILGQVRHDEIVANLVDRDGLDTPDGLALDPTSSPPHLYVVDAFNHRVLGWADAEGFADGRPADLVLGQPDRWSSGCNTGGPSLSSLCLQYEFNGIAVDNQGTVWVSDGLNHRVLGFHSPFTADTVADRVLGRSGCRTGPRGLCLPGGLAADEAGNLFVADIGNNRILEFDEPGRRDAVADRVLGAANFHQSLCHDAVTCFSEENHTHPGLNVYGGMLAFDTRGRLLVGNWDEVYVFERPLQAVGRWRSLIRLTPEEGKVHGVATDSTARIYVSAGSHVYRFSRSGAGPSLSLGDGCSGTETGPGPAALCIPTGLATGPGDELFVSDAGANRVVVFELP